MSGRSRKVTARSRSRGQSKAPRARTSRSSSSMTTNHEEIRRWAEEINATAYVPKPFDLGALLPTLDEVCAAKGIARRPAADNFRLRLGAADLVEVLVCLRDSAHRFRCAAAIAFLPAALIFRRLRFGVSDPAVDPAG